MRSRLWLRVYLGTVVGLAMLFGFAVLYSRLSFGDRRQETELWSRKLFDELAQNRGDPGALEQSVKWMRKLSSLSVTLYGADGAVIASTAAQVPAPLEAAEFRNVLENGTQLAGWSRTSVQVPLGPREVGVGVLTFRPGGGTQTATWLGADLVLMLLLALVFTRHLVKPLQRIGAAATRFGKGELSARSGVLRSDEIGDVARAFDETADRVTRLMTSQRELIANVSHELRTPLARMRVAIDLIADGMTQQSVEVLPEIASDLQELERLLDDVMTVARLDLGESKDGRSLTPLRKEPTRPHELVDRAAERFRAQHPERVLELQVEHSSLPFELDPVLMRRVIDNLIDNARKYSEPGTPIAIEVAARADGVALTVRDQGIGIESADLEHIFTPFFRTDRSRNRATGGVGLGLVLARRVVEAHGGSIRIESTVGKGTAVCFELPARRPSSAPP